LPTVREEAGTVQIQYPRFSLLDWSKLSADIVLNGSIPWQLELKGGVSKLNADLSALRLESFDDLSIVLPTGAAARLQVKGGVSKLASWSNAWAPWEASSAWRLPTTRAPRTATRSTCSAVPAT
jgi:hypothetical protein